ncbi:hypothetical protein F4819DRAFT_444300 [Hypoxylon fuscum]|nr:hypothetical protein F4819DRAFT_444300 [Hypoxylon fuscum]
MGSTRAADATNGDESWNIYFAYGSNLSPTQMQDRCPQSPPIGLAHLPGWTWIINERGFANIVPHQVTLQSEEQDTHTFTSLHKPMLPSSKNQGIEHQDKLSGDGGNKEGEASGKKAEKGPGAYGVVYRLHPDDEENLDRCEGVPWAYEREFMDAELVAPHVNPAIKQLGSGLERPKMVRVLVYVDKHRVTPDEPRPEYVERMNRGIDEAMGQWGLPGTYVDDVMRPFIPTEEYGGDVAS